MGTNMSYGWKSALIFACFPKDRASGRTQIFQEFFPFNFQLGNRGTHSNRQSSILTESARDSRIQNSKLASFRKACLTNSIYDNK